jgi:hypothetical protein
VTEPMIPSGEGLALRRLRIADEDVVRLGGILLGEDGLASLHGDGEGVIVIVTTTDRAAELDDWLTDIGREIPLQPAPDTNPSRDASRSPTR